MTEQEAADIFAQSEEPYDASERPPIPELTFAEIRSRLLRKTESGSEEEGAA